MTPETQPALEAQRLTARPYSLTALQRFASCPYQFLLAAIYRLAPLEEPAPLQYLDPLTRGSLFHAIQTEFLRVLRKNGQLPVDEAGCRPPAVRSDGRSPGSRRRARQARARHRSRLARRDRVDDARLAIAGSTTARHERRDLGARAVRARVRPAARRAQRTRVDGRAGPVDGRFLLRGSIDLVEHAAHDVRCASPITRPGENRTTLATIVDGGRVLQPILYGMALEAITGELVEEGRLSYCTTAGRFSSTRFCWMTSVAAAASKCSRSSTAPSSAARWRPAGRDACGRLRFRRRVRPDEERRTAEPDGLLCRSRCAPEDAMT